MRRLLLLALLTSGLVTAGCGDSGDSDDSGGGPSTREEFVAQGDAICRRTNDEVADLNRRIQAIDSGSTGAGTPTEALAEAAPLLREAYELQREALGEFRALTSPEGDEATIEKIVEGGEQQVALVGRLADAAEAKDAGRLKEIGAELQTTRDRVRGLFQGYGFEECGSAG